MVKLCVWLDALQTRPINDEKWINHCSLRSSFIFKLGSTIDNFKTGNQLHFEAIIGNHVVYEINECGLCTGMQGDFRHYLGMSVKHIKLCDIHRLASSTPIGHYT